MKLTNALLAISVILLAVIAATLVIQAKPVTLTPDAIPKSEYFMVTEIELLREHSDYGDLSTKELLNKTLNMYSSLGFELVEIIPTNPPFSHADMYYFVRKNKDIYYDEMINQKEKASQRLKEAKGKVQN